MSVKESGMSYSVDLDNESTMTGLESAGELSDPTFRRSFVDMSFSTEDSKLVVKQFSEYTDPSKGIFPTVAYDPKKVYPEWMVRSHVHRVPFVRTSSRRRTPLALTPPNPPSPHSNSAPTRTGLPRSRRLTTRSRTCWRSLRKSAMNANGRSL